jgi:cytochrome P450
LSSRLAETNQLENDKIVASEMFDHMVAAIESSRIILTYLQWELSQRPELQNAFRTELFGLSPAIIYPPKQNAENEEIVMPDPKAIDSLPLLDAILKETLRLYSPSPAIQPRVTPPGGTTIDGFRIPGGITVGTAAYCLHMNERVFPNAAEGNESLVLGFREWIQDVYCESFCS